MVCATRWIRGCAGDGALEPALDGELAFLGGGHGLIVGGIEELLVLVDSVGTGNHDEVIDTGLMKPVSVVDEVRSFLVG